MLIQRIKKRGANIVVEAHGELILLPTGDVGRWKQRLSQRVVQETSKEAPTNKRPRWGHYGTPLKKTFTASSSTRLTRGGGFLYSAIGSTAAHAWYVDQGTGVFAGRGPYLAKILPPWHRGEGSLYEHTWRPGGPGNPRVRPVFIKGQRGQHFFDKGLDRAWRSLGDGRYRSLGAARVSEAMRTFPEGLANFVGSTPNNSAFRASRAQWREWRDERYNSGRMVGRDGGLDTREATRRYLKTQATQARRIERAKINKARRAHLSALRSKAWREKNKPASSPAKSVTKTPRTTARQRADLSAKREMAAFYAKHGKFSPAGWSPAGFWYYDAGGTKHFRVWSIRVADLYINAGIKVRPLPKGP